MNMRLLAFAALAVTAVISTMAENAAPQKKAKPWLKRRPAVQSGGLVIKEEEGPRLLIVNAQRRIGQEDLEKMAFQLITYASLPWKTATAAVAQDAKLVARAELAKGAAGVVVVVDVPDAPALLVAPEEGWSAVNVGKLAEGDPQAPILAARFKKEMWRAAAWAVGGGNSSFQPCLLKGVSTMKDLDAIPLLQLGPEPNNKMIDEAHRRGVKSVRLASYTQACQEGWAPAPTNDVQKAIWDKVHQLPTEPIKIKPETKKVTE